MQRYNFVISDTKTFCRKGPVHKISFKDFPLDVLHEASYTTRIFVVKLSSLITAWCGTVHTKIESCLWALILVCSPSLHFTSFICFRSKYSWIVLAYCWLKSGRWSSFLSRPWKRFNAICLDRLITCLGSNNVFKGKRRRYFPFGWRIWVCWKWSSHHFSSALNCLVVETWSN